jgi:multicomponent K+:H+ antiporter subunit A
VGTLHVPSAFFFDIGVFLLVVGATTVFLIALAHQSLRAHRLDAETIDSASPVDQTPARWTEGFRQ